VKVALTAGGVILLLVALVLSACGSTESAENPLSEEARTSLVNLSEDLLKLSSYYISVDIDPSTPEGRRELANIEGRVSYDQRHLVS